MRDLTSGLPRRSFLLGLSLTGAALLGGCGGAGGAGSTATATAAAAGDTAAGAAQPGSDPQRLNLALNLFYAGAQFHALAGTGTGLPATLLAGAGAAGGVTGARAAALADPLVIAAAAGLAADKQAAVAALRAQLGSAAAAMPAIDLSAGGGTGFARVLASGGGAADPYGSDAGYLLGGLVLDYATPAVVRGLLARMDDAGSAAVLQAVLAGAIHQSAVIRTLLAEQATADPLVAAQTGAVFATLATLDGTAPDDGMLADADAGTADLFDAAGRPIPFTRPPAQALRLAFLGAGAAGGGFFPRGMNGVA